MLNLLKKRMKNRVLVYPDFSAAEIEIWNKSSALDPDLEFVRQGRKLA